MTMDPSAPIDTVQIEDPEGVLPYITINKADFNPAIHTPLGGKPRRKKSDLSDVEATAPESEAVPPESETLTKGRKSKKTEEVTQ